MKSFIAGIILPFRIWFAGLFLLAILAEWCGGDWPVLLVAWAALVEGWAAHEWWLAYEEKRRDRKVLARWAKFAHEVPSAPTTEVDVDRQISKELRLTRWYSA